MFYDTVQRIDINSDLFAFDRKKLALRIRNVLCVFYRNCCSSIIFGNRHREQITDIAVKKENRRRAVASRRDSNLKNALFLP